MGVLRGSLLAAKAELEIVTDSFRDNGLMKREENIEVMCDNMNLYDCGVIFDT